MSIVNLAPREASTFPYERFKYSPVLHHSIKKLTAMKMILGSGYTEYKKSSGMSYEVCDQLAFDQLFTYIDQAIDYLRRYFTYPDESTLHSLKATLDMLESQIKHFDMHSVEPLRVFVTKLIRLLGTYHRSTDVTGWIVDISNTFKVSDSDIKEVEVYTNKQAARMLLLKEGDSDSKMYKVFSSVVNTGAKGSRQVMEGLWLLKTRDIFHCSLCTH